MSEVEGKKFDHGKPRIGLVSGIFLIGLAKVLTFGAKKYAAHNWRNGIALSRVFDALERHLWAFWMGEDLDPETGMPHLDHAACELMFLRELWETHKDLDDRWVSPRARVLNPLQMQGMGFEPNGAVMKPAPAPKEAAAELPIDDDEDFIPKKPRPKEEMHPIFKEGSRVSARLEPTLPWFPAIITKVLEPIKDERGWLFQINAGGQMYTVPAAALMLEARPK